MMNRDPVVIACAADAQYIMPLAVMLHSLAVRLTPNRALAIYIVDVGVPKADRERLRSSLPQSARVTWVRPKEIPLADLPLWGRMPATTYQRLFLPDLLPRGIARALWLDCDMVVLKDVATLWDAELGERALLAVQDMIVPFVSSRYGVARYRELALPPRAKYFNAGLMVVNLDYWRRQAVTQAALAYLKANHDTVFFWDQEALNAVLAGRWEELDPRWNQNASVSGRPFFDARFMEDDHYRQVVQDPWVVHFGGSLKPWLIHNGSSARALYFQHLDETAWAGWRPKRTPRTVLLGIYESSRLRNLVYPVEKFGMELLRRRTLGARSV